jgi:hypothetical protein
MSTDPHEPRPWKRRKTLVVDPLVQGRAVLTIVGIIAGFVMIGVGSSFWGRSPDDQLTSDAASTLAHIVDAAIVVIGVVAIAIYVLWIMHRFLGPARVIRHALAGMVEGDFGRRLQLRKGDYLKDLAATAETVAQKMRDDRARSDELFAVLESALRRGDVAAARAALLASQAPKSAVVEAVTPALESSASR